MTTDTPAPDGPRFPQIEVELSGFDSNSMAIVSRVARFMRRARDEDGQRIVTQEQLDEFRNEALSGDHDHVLTTCAAWVEIN